MDVPPYVFDILNDLYRATNWQNRGISVTNSNNVNITLNTTINKNNNKNTLKNTLKKKGIKRRFVSEFRNHGKGKLDFRRTGLNGSHKFTLKEYDEGTWIRCYANGDIVPIFGKKMIEYKKYQKTRRLNVLMRKEAMSHVKRNLFTSPTKKNNSWYLIPDVEYEQKILNELTLKYRYYEIYEKGNTKVWRDYNNEPVILIRNFKRDQRFLNNLREWLNATEIDSDPNEEFTNQHKMINIKKIKLILMTNYILPDDLKEKFIIKNLKDPWYDKMSV